ncbi:hypothetical protein Vadar_012226 [Vaccinium darrowii]|uniref:Uncharacterized protein n=1 Tax=Vaccinium darrowii TaxID=229202 RepID=A0ACB7ZC23_9ERIC|nr:hypothetical protein Vadar_012226 [Vaccinium darrowii]
MSSNENQWKYRGIRLSRKGDKWVSVIQVQRSRKCIWLCTFETPELKATAHDIASKKLRGQEVFLNFSANLEYYQMPASSLPKDIRATAVSAMAAYMRANSSGSGTKVVEVIDEFIDEEEMFNMPKMIVYMANAMHVGLPQIYGHGTRQHDEVKPAEVPQSKA